MVNTDTLLVGARLPSGDAGQRTTLWERKQCWMDYSAAILFPLSLPLMSCATLNNVLNNKKHIVCLILIKIPNGGQKLARCLVGAK